MPIQTRAQYDTVKEALRLELERPEAEQDLAFIERAITELRVAEEQFADQIDPSRAAAQQAAQGTAMASLVPPRASDAAVQQGALSQLDLGDMGQLPAQSHAMSQGVNERLRSMQDMLARAVLDKDDQAARAAMRREQSAGERLRIEELARRQGVSQSGIDIDRAAGSMIPDIAMGIGPGLAIRGTRGISSLARIAGEGGVGALSALASTPLDEDPGVNLAVSAAGGMGIGFLAELPTIVRRTALNSAYQATKNPETIRNMALAESAGIRLSLAEASMDDRVASMERAIANVPGNPRTQFSKMRQQQIAERFAQLDEQLNPERLSPYTIITQTKKAYQDSVHQLQRIASANFRDTLRPAAEAVGATIDDQGRIIGGQRVIPVDTLLSEAQFQLKRALEGPRTRSPQQIATLRNTVQELQRAKRSGGLTLGKAQEMLQEFGEAANPSGRTVVSQTLNAADVFDSKTMLRALEADIDAAASNPEALGQEAASALIRAREQYAADKAVIREMEDQAVARLLGKVTGRVDREDFARVLLDMPTDEFKELMNALDLAKPGLANATRSRIFAELTDKHRALAPGGGEAADAMMDVSGFVKEMVDMPFSKFKAVIGMDDVAAQQMHNTFKVLQLIQRGPQGTSATRAELQWLENLAINIVSHSPEFVSRFIAGRLGPAFFERALFTDEGIRAFRTLGMKGASRTAYVQAANELLELAAGIEAQKEELIKQEQQRQLTELLRAPGRQLP